MHESFTSLKASQKALPHGSIEGGRSPKPSLRETYERLGDTENDTQSLIPERLHSDTSIKGDAHYAEDLRRVNSAVRSESQIFRKALVHNQADLTIGNFVQDNDSSDSSDSPIASSISSRSSDLLVNMPPQWAKKARSGKDLPAGQQDTGNKFVAAVAEDAASQVTLSSQSSTSTAKERVVLWELRDDDVSDSPPSRFRNATLGKILEKEISTIAERAKTTNRIGELRKRNSAEQLGKRYPSQGRKDGQDKIKHRSKDSYPLSRQLVGATSSSPSPSRDVFNKTPGNSAEATRDLGQNSYYHPSDSELVGGTSHQQPSKAEIVERATPVLTGVWFDTPLPIGSRGPPMSAPGEHSPLFGTSTIQSLEELITNNTNVSALLRLSLDISTTNPAPIPKRSTSTKALVLCMKDDTEDFLPISPITVSGSYFTDPRLFAYQLFRLYRFVPYLRGTK
ncbi:MAG: hypothetical protein Q9199_000649 [Rusavskia elegans]